MVVVVVVAAAAVTAAAAAAGTRGMGYDDDLDFTESGGVSVAGGRFKGFFF